LHVNHAYIAEIAADIVSGSESGELQTGDIFNEVGLKPNRPERQSMCFPRDSAPVSGGRRYIDQPSSKLTRKPIGLAMPTSSLAAGFKKCSQRLLPARSHAM
jgi:hypothetical protein